MAEGRRPSDVVLHQARVRSANDETLRASTGNTSITIRCECGDTVCAESWTLSTEWLRGFRRNGSRSIVRAGHEVIEVSRVVERRGSVAVVQSTYVGNADMAAEDLHALNFKRSVENI